MDVEKIARLARLGLTEEEKSSMDASLQSIFSWVERLQEVDVSSHQPTYHPTHQQMVLRADAVSPDTTVQDLLRNAPEAQMNMFVVPKMVE